MAVTHSRSMERAEVRRLPGQARGLARPGVPLPAGGEPAGRRRTLSGPPGQDAGLADVDAGLAAKRLLNLNELGTREELLPALTPFFPKHARARHGGARDLLPHRQPVERGRHRAQEAADRRAVPPVEAARSWCAGRPSSNGPSICGAEFSSALSGWPISGGACAASPATRRFLPALLALSGNRADPDGEPARPGARQPAVRRFRAGRGGGRAAAGRAQRAGLPAAHRQVELRAAAGELRAFGAAGAVRHRAGHQRRQGQPLRLPAGGDHPRAAGLLSWPATSRSAGTCCATRAKRARRWRALTSKFDIPPVEYTLPVLVSVALSLVFFFLQKDMGPALVFACLFLVLYGIARGSAFVPVAGLALLGAGFARGLSARRAAHGRRPRLDVAFALGQPGARRRSAGAFAVGLRHRRRCRHRHRAGRSATGAGGAHRPDSLGARRAVGLPRHRGGLRALRVPGLPLAADRPARALGLRILPGGGTGGRDGPADSADRRRLAGRAAAFRRGHAVPQLRPHRDDRQLRHVRNSGVDLGAAVRGAANTAPFRAPGDRRRARFFAIAGAVVRGQGGLRAGAAQRAHHRRRHAGGAGRWRAPLPVQSAPAGDHARDSQGHGLRPQRPAARHQQLGRTGKASRRLPGARHRYRPRLPARATAATIPSAA